MIVGFGPNHWNPSVTKKKKKEKKETEYASIIRASDGTNINNICFDLKIIWAANRGQSEWNGVWLPLNKISNLDCEYCELRKQYLGSSLQMGHDNNSILD